MADPMIEQLRADLTEARAELAATRQRLQETLDQVETMSRMVVLSTDTMDRLNVAIQRAHDMLNKGA